VNGGRLLNLLALLPGNGGDAVFAEAINGPAHIGGIAVDPRNSDILVAGDVQGKTIFPNGQKMSPAGESDLWLARVAKNGTFRSILQIPANTAQPTGIGVDALGNTYVAGFFSGTIRPNPRQSSVKFTDPDTGGFYFSYSPNFRSRFLDAVFGDGNVRFNSLQVSSNGRGTLGGQFSGSGTIDTPTADIPFNLPSTRSTGALLSFAEQGTRLATKYFRGSSNVAVWDGIDDTVRKRIFVAVSYSGTLDANPNDGVKTLTAAGAAPSSAIVSLTETGGFRFASNLTGNASVTTFKLAANESHVFGIGGFAGTFDANGGTGVFNLTSKTGTNGQPSSDVFGVQLDASDGSFTRGFRFGGKRNEVATDLTAAIRDNQIVLFSNYIVSSGDNNILFLDITGYLAP
jgi:hypothetical protein